MQAGASGTIITSDGTLIPAADEWAESWEVVGGQITFYPTPTFNQTRYFWYAAGHVPSGDSYSYPLMTAAMATVVLLKAQALALLEQANEAAKEAWSYETGDQAVNKQRLAEALQRQARLLDEQYVRALEGLRGPVSVLG